MKSGFKIVADKIRRGNGVWTKVVRLHNEFLVEIRGSLISCWTPYWSLAVGKEGEIKARFVEEYNHANNAHQAAKDYVSGILSL